MEGSGRELERQRDMTEEHGGDEDPGDGREDRTPEDVGDDAEAGEVAVEEDDGEDDCGDGDDGGWRVR